MIAPILEFFKKEKAWTVLLFLMIFVYGFIWFTASQQRVLETPRATSGRSLQDFKKMETKFQERAKDPETMKKFSREKPGLALLFNLMSVFVLGALGAGLFFDAKILFNPAYRESLARPPVSVSTEWKFSMIFKVVMLYMAGSFITGALLGVLKRFAFPHISENFFLLMHTTLTDILVFIFIVWVIQQAKGNWRDIGFHLKGTNVFKEMFAGIGGYAAVLPLFLGCLALLLLITRLFSYEPPPHPLVNVFLEEEQRSPWLVFYSIFLAVGIGPLFEELFFRGLCYPVLRHHWGKGWAAVVTSVFFAAIHGNPFAFLPIFILGLCLAYLYEKRGSLIPCMTLHVIHNAIFIGFFFLGKSIITYAGS